MKCLILAAGYATRLYPLTENFPKPLLKVGEKSILDWLDLAEKFIGSVYRNYAVKDFEKSNGIVLHSTYSNRSPYNTCNPCGVDECNSWGDYFYMEALTRLQKDWQIYW